MYNNQIIDLLKAGYLPRILDLAYIIGNNRNLEIDQNSVNTRMNFLLSAFYHCIPDEQPD
jgi:hypothetical protein